MSGDSDDSASMAFVWIEPLIEQADVILAVRQVARSSAVRITQSLEELCPVHRDLIAMSGRKRGIVGGGPP